MNQMKSVKSMIDSEKKIFALFSLENLLYRVHEFFFLSSSSIVKSAFNRHHFATQEFCIFWFDDFY